MLIFIFSLFCILFIFLLVFIMSYSSDINSIFLIDVVDSLVQQLFRLTHVDELEVVVSRNVGAKSLKGLKKKKFNCQKKWKMQWLH